MDGTGALSVTGSLGGPPVGVNPGGQSSDVGQQVEGQIAAPKAPPTALVTKEMLASVRPKSPPNPPRSPRVSSPQVTATEVGNRWSSNLRTPGATIEEENAGGSVEVDDLLPDREGVDLPTDTFNDGGDPTEAEVLESAGDVEMEPEKEAEAPAVGEEETPGREAEVPQATTTTTEPSVESPAAKRAASPVREGRRAREPAGDQKKEVASGAVARVCLFPTLRSTRTTTGTCGILRRPRRRLQPRSLEGAYTIMRTRRTRSIRERRPSWSQRKSGITVSIVPTNPRGARGHRQDRRRAGRIGGSSFSMSWLGRLVSLSSMP